MENNRMAQINDSQPTHPVITFQVDLSALNQYSHLTPGQYQDSPDRGRTYTENQATTRVTWFPGLLVGENRELKHGDTFILYGAKAQYYRAEIAKGNFPELKIVSAS
jgi:hypothetical protein